MGIQEKKLIVKSDHRGWLAEIIRPEDVRNPEFGHLLITTAKPGQVKGNHYHKRKTEWYCVIKGNGVLTIINNKSKEKKEIVVGEDNLSLIEIPPNHTHLIKNSGNEDLYLLTYTNEPFNELDTDTYTE